MSIDGSSKFDPYAGDLADVPIVNVNVMDDASGRAQLEAAGIRWPDFGLIEPYGPRAVRMTATHNAQKIYGRAGGLAGYTHGVVEVEVVFDICGTELTMLAEGDGEWWLPIKMTVNHRSQADAALLRLIDGVMVLGKIPGCSERLPAYPEQVRRADPSEVDRLGEEIARLASRR